MGTQPANPVKGSTVTAQDAQRKNRRRRRWGYVILTIIFVWALLVLLAAIFGHGSWGQAHAATLTSQPSQAWLIRGRIASTRESVGTPATIARNRRVTCMEQPAKKEFSNVFGQLLIWLKMTKSWCYSRQTHEITQQPPAFVTSGVTTVGSLTQWKIDETASRTTEFYPYEGWEKGGSRSRAVMKASRCFPTPFGCPRVGSTTQTIEILGHSDGSYSLY